MSVRDSVITWSDILEPETIENDLSGYLSHMPPDEQGRTIHNYLEENYGDIEGTTWEEEIEYEDGVCRYDCYDGKFVYEFKTKNDHRMTEEYLPVEEDLLQIQTYLEATDSEHGVLVYISRQSFDIKEYLVYR